MAKTLALWFLGLLVAAGTSAGELPGQSGRNTPDAASALRDHLSFYAS